MANLTELQADIAELVTTVTNTVGVQKSATEVLNGIAPIIQSAVDAALAADNAVDDAAAAAASASVKATLATLKDSTGLLATAVAANPGGPGGPPPPPPESASKRG
jgi:hypothetical protein